MKNLVVELEEASKVRKAIRYFGGDFMKQIGNAIDYADIWNLQKIKDTWFEDLNHYLELYNKGKEKGIF